MRILRLSEKGLVRLKIYWVDSTSFKVKRSSSKIEVKLRFVSLLESSVLLRIYRLKARGIMRENPITRPIPAVMDAIRRK
jgi:hypothetical protein